VVVAYSAWPPGERERAGPDDPNLDLLRRDLERAVGRLPGAGGVKIRVEPTFGRASSHLVGMASDEAADLIVVGTHQRSGIAQLWHGSVSRGVLHEAPMSVACVPPPRRSGTAVGSASAGG
jgi:nucleotide-binding universal stress UspA family protein